jgi:phosphoglycerate dehydrogenase-like enzyme
MTTVLLANTLSPDRSAAILDELSGSIPAEALRNASTAAETSALLPEADMLVVGRFDEAWLTDAADLRLIQTLWAGVDLYPLDEIESAGVALANAAGIHAEPIAEQVLGYLLQFERKLREAGSNQRRGVWESVRGGELRGKTLGIVGVGAIGTRVAELAEPFDMEIIGTKRTLTEQPEPVDELLAAENYPELLERSDYVVLACPLTEETEEMIGIEELRLLGQDGILVNVARGEIVEQDSLVRALQSGLLRGAALDVFDEEPLPPDSMLWDLSDAVVTPHMAWTTPRTAGRVADLIVDNYEAVESGDDAAIRNRVL